jgi:hypothetical protein
MRRATFPCFLDAACFAYFLRENGDSVSRFFRVNRTWFVCFENNSAC